MIFEPLPYNDFELDIPVSGLTFDAGTLRFTLVRFGPALTLRADSHGDAAGWIPATGNEERDRQRAVDWARSSACAHLEERTRLRRDPPRSSLAQRLLAAVIHWAQE